VTNTSARKTTSDLDWLSARQTMLKGLKRQVARRLGPEPSEIRRFRQRLDRELNKPFKISSKRELLKELLHADIICGGDFHAYGQAQRTHLKIIKDRVAKRPLVIALEAFSPEGQEHLDNYVAGRLDEKSLLKKTKWESNWGFPWENYRSLVEYARENKIPILAIGTSTVSANLKIREEAAARVLANYFSRKNLKVKPQIYCIFGELHLSQESLPKAIVEKTEDLKILTIHLNPEPLYFSLAKKGLENKVDVVRYKKNVFAVTASPPWVQWQSYLMYLENNLDQSLDEGETPDLSGHLSSLVKLASLDLKVSFDVSDLSVYTSNDDAFVIHLARQLKKKELKSAKAFLERERSFYLPKGKIFFLARTTINHAAEIAGQYIHAELSGMSRVMWRMPDDFLQRIWVDTIGFFVSKLINHKRHSETLQDLELRLSALSSQDQGREALSLALEQRFNELLFFHSGRRRVRKLKRGHTTSQLEAAKILGGMMGERLYLAVREGKLKLPEVVEMMRKNPEDADFAQFYEQVVMRLGPRTGATRTRKERL
jgi:hypothetical protein